jgi:hypothetical protein
MNAEFFALAFSAALNSKLLALDLLLIENRRPRAMFLCVLLGGMTVALTIGLVEVLTVHADAISSQGGRRAPESTWPGPAAACHRRAARDRPPARPAAGVGPGPAPAGGRSARAARHLDRARPGRPGPNLAGDRHLIGTRSQRLTLRFNPVGGGVLLEV